MTGAPFQLSAPDWARLRDLLDRALEQPLAQREAWLASLAADDAVLAPHLRRLLAQSGSDAAAQLDALPAFDVDEAPGGQVGPYRLLRALGEGGMASVWLAERTDWLQQRQVALKLPHGAWRRAGLAQRLAREREILATLEHAHIARLYDAGVTDSGQPFLALEYVQGEPIDRWCDSHHAGVAQRLALFLQVCDAVAHAHARLVVHRDLKPANILVDPAGQAKLLDFGIAKLLEGDTVPETQLTQEHGRALTPDYAAPEQILGRPLGTAADVYSLGVLLFELLAGVRPYRLARGSRAALEDAIVNAEVPRPSEAAADPARRRALRGDLDTIVLKALKKAPDERYATVAAFADDLRRHLAHQPVQARPDSRLYQARKFVQRHRAGVVMSFALAAALASGAGVALWQAAEARASRDQALAAKARADAEAVTARRAERGAEAAADLSSFLLSDLAANRADEAMLEQLERALVMVRAQYRDDAALRGRMLMDIGIQMRWISMQARAAAVFAEAEPLLLASGERAAWAQMQCIQASWQARSGRADAARTLIERAMRELEPSLTNAQVTARAECLSEEALILRYAGDPEAAISRLQQALVLTERIGRAEREDFSEVLNGLARAQYEVGRYGDAAASARRSIALLERIGRQRTPGLRNAWGMLAQSLRDGGRPLEALPAHGGNGSFDPATDLVSLPLRYQYAVTSAYLRGRDEDHRLLDALIDQALAEDNPIQARGMLSEQARAYLAFGQIDKARERLRRAAPMFADARARRQVQARTFALASADWALAAGRLDEAQASIDEAREIIERMPRTPDIVRRDLRRLNARLALARGNPAGALADAEAALVIARAHSLDTDASFTIAEDLLLRARAWNAIGRPDAASADAHEAARQARSAAGDEHPLVRQALALAR